MRRSIGSALFVLLTTSGSLVITATPASATSWGTAVFTGTASAGPLAAPPGPSSAGEGWAFNGTGHGHGMWNGVPVGPDFAAAVTGVLNNGLLGGAWCGASGGAGGSGYATIGHATWTLSDVGWVQSAGSVIPYTGTASETGQSGVIFGGVSAIPPNPVTGGGSCVSGTATTFIVVGHATIFVP